MFSLWSREEREAQNSFGSYGNSIVDGKYYMNPLKLERGLQWDGKYNLSEIEKELNNKRAPVILSPRNWLLPIDKNFISTKMKHSAWIPLKYKFFMVGGL